MTIRSPNLKRQFNLEALWIAEEDLVEGKSRHRTLVERNLLVLQELEHVVQVGTRESNMVQRACLLCGPTVKPAGQVNDGVALAVKPVTGKTEVRPGTVDQSQQADVEISKFIEILWPAPHGVMIESSDMHDRAPEPAPHVGGVIPIVAPAWKSCESTCRRALPGQAATIANVCNGDPRFAPRPAAWSRQREDQPAC